MNLDDLAYCAIHPAVGVTRLGNSPEGFFIGPEAPGVAARPADGFKDAEGRVKRQASRFRVYGFDKDHNPLGEVTANEAVIRWTVELANGKAAWFKFHGRFHQSDAPENRRNPTIGVNDPQERTALVISPGPRSVEGANADGTGAKFDTGTFLGTPVPLGELRTDEAGRLLVLGGMGHSASVRPANPVISYANNDYWFDDTSDGPVTATVTVGAGRSIPVTPARVLVAPPDFSPDTTNLVTLYDVAREVAENAGWLPRASDVSFTRDILPLLTRICGYAWVSGIAVRGHGRGRAGDFLDPGRLARLASNAPEDAPQRKEIFSKLRTPGAEDVTQANYSFMPQLAGDDGTCAEGKPLTWFTILPGQYERMRRWADGDFIADAADTGTGPVQLADLPLAEQPHALDRAALEACNGGPFFPGIEMTFTADDPGTWAAPFRLREDLPPGDVTKYMAVPWQADFYECNTHWWPAQRPDDVLPEEQYRELIRTAADAAGEQYVYRTPWARGLGLQALDLPHLERLPGETDEQYEDRYERTWQLIRDHAGDNDMVEKWSHLGFVVARTDASGETVLVETERAAQVGIGDREWFYFLQHPDRFPQQAEASRHYAQAVLDRAASDPTLPPAYHPFRYSPEAFTSRLELIYSNLVEDGDQADPATDPFFRTREDVIERIRQFAPFNLLDGAWLRNVTQAGPISEVHSLLFSIWVDEQGNGNPALNHANLYTDLLHSVGLYLPPVDSYEFAMLPEMLDSAYAASAFELAVSQHSEEFFPEILGMTLQLEWEVLGLKPTVRLFEYHGINPQFYTMHIGIDNAASGHGAKARDAVVQYLEGVYDSGGEVAVQQQWQRIWNGYVAFATVGNVGNDLWDLLHNPPSLDDQMIDLIARKAPYASQNHDGKELGGNTLNDWFLDPPGLLQELQDSGLILPGEPENSPFFEKTTYTGPMYKVFSDDELELWRRWTRSLTAPPTAPVLTPLKAMMVLVDALRSRQAGNPAHTATTITGPDPADPARTRTESVAWWFTQPTGALLAALAHPENQLVSPGHPEDSSFINDLLSPANAMGKAFAGKIPGTGRTGRDIAVGWISAGCPLPEPAPSASRALLGATVPLVAGEEAAGADGRVPMFHGMGVVH